METTSKGRHIFQYFLYLLLACGTAGIVWYYVRPSKTDEISNKNVNLFLENAISDVQQDLRSDITRPDIASRLAWFKANTTLYQQASHNKDKSIKAESQKFKGLIVQAQQKGFPTLRKAYVDSKQEVLKQQHIDIELSGDSKEILVITGSMFEPKKNQQAFLKDIEAVVRDLRFQEVVYKWSVADDSNKHYTIDSKRDDEV